MTDLFSHSRRTLLRTAGFGILAAPMLMTRAAHAQQEEQVAPAARVLAPDVHHFKVGTFEVVVVKDGVNAGGKPNETFGTNQPAETVSALLEKNFLPKDTLVNSYAPVLVKTGSEVVLFDTGLGEAARKNGGGRLLEGLAAAGYTPEDVTVVVITHMHGDHIGGLMTGETPTFPKARYIAGQAEYDFWSNTARVGTPAENGHKAVERLVKPLVEKITFVGDGADVTSGVRGMLAAGHSPGHMIYMVESESRKLLLTADTANHFVLSLQRPDWEVRFDMDKAAAAATRKKVFDMVATDRIAFLGYHMPFPAAGYVEKLDDGYRFVPKAYQFDI